MDTQRGQVSTLVVVAAMVALIAGGVIGWSVKSSQVNGAPISQNQMQKPNTYSQAEDDLSQGMQKLWGDHVIWTRSFIVSTAYDNKDLDSVTKRLLKNQEDLGNAIKPYYGEEAGNKLTMLLKEHITTAADLVMAAKKADQTAQTKANDAWYANANEIADFLASANPNWPKDQTRVMLREHLDLTKQAAVDILGNKYDAGIVDFDKIHEQILGMSDMLTEGIVKQFPDKFK
jgi:hypothetical protein